ncbi:hypothetical protein ACHAXA_008982 [Cyclostephanos tholiformis]|uniref:Uncharacterized protein n=1 Tax=Cyclostephanos tholiformis TaxID=382380 RepID=A0ABD3RE87_9STRA
MAMKRMLLNAVCLLPIIVDGFGGTFLPQYHRDDSRWIRLHSEAVDAESSSASDAGDGRVRIDPREAVKLFGRLAEKYIMLDASAGMCCYSGCSDCEYREPGGGYRMADQSSARPKWIPCYDRRVFASQGKEHTTRWSLEIFSDGKPVVTREQFVERVIGMKFVPPLGGPYLAASSAAIEDDSAASALFDVLAGENEKLTRHRMEKGMKSLANGEEGLTWPMFSAALGVK